MKIFDDLKSFVHTALGGIAYLLSNLEFFITATCAFVSYQLFEKEDYEAKFYDVIEWCAGALCAMIFKFVILLSI